MFWLEEAFYEDAVMYRRLKGWIRSEGLATLIADGEGRGLADPNMPPLFEGVEPAAVGSSTARAAELLLEMVREGIVDVLQWDVCSPGLTRWLEVADRVEQWGRLASPHHYGTLLGNYHRATSGWPCRASASPSGTRSPRAASRRPATPSSKGTPGAVAPGFGLALDEDAFGRAVREGGFSSTAP